MRGEFSDWKGGGIVCIRLLMEGMDKAVCWRNYLMKRIKGKG